MDGHLFTSSSHATISTASQRYIYSDVQSRDCNSNACLPWHQERKHYNLCQVVRDSYQDQDRWKPPIEELLWEHLPGIS